VPVRMNIFRAVAAALAMLLVLGLSGGMASAHSCTGQDQATASSATAPSETRAPPASRPDACLFCPCSMSSGALPGGIEALPFNVPGQAAYHGMIRHAWHGLHAMPATPPPKFTA
jgi:hypothetical protein